MKVKISHVEANIDYKIKRNFKSIGIDTAQTTGICILRTDEEYIYIDHLVLGFKTQNEKEIYHTMVKTFELIIEEDQFAVIETVFVGLNPFGAIQLAHYGAFVVSECIKKGIDYERIGATSARSKFKINTRILGKGKTKEAVGLWIVEKLGIEFTDNNLNDALVLGLCGICENFDFKPLPKVKKKQIKVKKVTKKTARKVRAKAKGSKFTMTEAKKAVKKTSKFVQVKNPRTGYYTKINKEEGQIISQKSSFGPYKNIPIVKEVS